MRVQKEHLVAAYERGAASQSSRVYNREVALNWARYVTRSDSGRGVFDVAAVFLAFLEAGDNPNARQSALRHAAEIERSAEAIVANAQQYLAFLDAGDDAGNAVIPAQFDPRRP
jgi:hypothetical protein